MAYTIAVAGKGGTGKTTISSLVLTKLLDDGRTPILAVDADPNSNFNEWLGLEVPSTLGSLQADLLKNKENIPAGMDKRRYLEYHLQTSVVEKSGFDLVAMGRSEGPGCYCHVNDILRGFLEELIPNYRYVVMDNEAGMEHMSRRTTRNVDALLLVSDNSPIGIRSARRIDELKDALEINVGRSYLVINRADPDLDERIEEEIDRAGLELLTVVPTDMQLIDFSLDHRSLLELPKDAPAKVAVDAALDRILE